MFVEAALYDGTFSVGGLWDALPRAIVAHDDARASGWGVGTNITICKPEAAFGRGVIVGHHPGTHELWRVELVPSQSKSGSVSVCAGAPRVLARSYFLTSREVERGLLQLGAA